MPGIVPDRSSMGRLGEDMPYNLLDTVVLVHDPPEQGLRRGDLGAIVQMYPPDGLEVEFVRASGRLVARKLS